ncbi:GumC family protein [Leptolyngbya sp. GGD]|uniref:GumC family protein n=1 Tax=Leptolyngbya sp. GGD TaxID=2997907 RepID=UPI00227D37DA|nr:polysaccharide biosynthesis tyrosine autokinase [Leptolyngbya sp. GGD]MCY6493235.1 polysaccharide biosynthesis tyrosine autokinase [Leptolyngbya sp. GGD]
MRAKNNADSGTVSLDNLEKLDFQNYWLIAKRRWKPTAAIITLSLIVAGFASSSQKPTYVATGKIVLKPNKIPALTGLGGEAAGRVSNLTMQSNPVRTEAQNVVSRPVMQQTIEALKLTDASGKPLHPDALAKAIKVKDVAGADVLQISYEDQEADKAAAVLNQVMTQYLNANVLENRSEAAAAREFIAEQLPKTEATVRQTETALRQFKEQSGIADAKAEEARVNEAISTLEKQIADASTDLAETTTRHDKLASTLNMTADRALEVSFLSQDDNIKQIAAQLQQVQTQLELERTRYTGKHPAIVNLQDREAALKNLLEERISQTVDAASVTPRDLVPDELRRDLMKDFVNAEVQKLGASTRLASLTETRDLYRDRMMQVPRLEQTQRELQRQLDAAQSTYETLLKRLQEVQLTEKQNVGTARIVERAAIPDSASGSKTSMFLLLGAAAGTLLSLAVITLLELRDKSIKTLKEARDLFGYTWLGTIPYFGRPLMARSKKQEWSIPELPVRDAPRSAVSGSYRMLQANLKFLSLDEKLKSVVITSSVPREGKSTIAANLAATMATLGRRTLLIDADLHHPSQHHIWNLTNVGGLSHVIVEQTNARDAIIPVMQNLDVLTCGVIPPNPLALLDSKRMASLIETFEQQYDFVIVDAPPLIVAAEALTLGRIVDGLILVARPGVVDHANATTAKELLNQSSQNVLGMVINGAVLENDAHDSYYDHDDYIHTPMEQVY